MGQPAHLCPPMNTLPVVWYPPSNHRAYLPRFTFQFPIGRRGPVTPSQPLSLPVTHPHPVLTEENTGLLMLHKIRAVASWSLRYYASCIRVSQVYLLHLCFPVVVEFLSQHKDHPSERKNSIRSRTNPTGTMGRTRNSLGKHNPLPPRS